MSWFEKLMPSRIKTERRTRSVPEGLWIKCPDCQAQLYRAEVERNLFVCPKCSHHMRLGARERLEIFLDENSGREIAANLGALYDYLQNRLLLANVSNDPEVLSEVARLLKELASGWSAIAEEVAG